MDTHQRDAQWLDVVADLLAHPLTCWPVPRVLAQLAETFDAPAATFYGRAGGGVPVQEAWPSGLYGRRHDEVVRWGLEQAPHRHPLLRYYLATGRADVMQVPEVPDRFADRRVRDGWRAACDDLIGRDVVTQVSVPVCLGPGTNRTFLVGRADPYSDGEMAALHRLQRVFVALDRQIAAHARWSDRTGDDAVPIACAVGLTPRETAVLDLLATGGTARAIARRLAVGERTVQKHLQRVYAKLGVADRLAAVQRAQLLGLLPSPRGT